MLIDGWHQQPEEAKPPAKHSNRVRSRRKSFPVSNSTSSTSTLRATFWIDYSLRLTQTSPLKPHEYSCTMVMYQNRSRGLLKTHHDVAVIFAGSYRTSYPEFSWKLNLFKLSYQGVSVVPVPARHGGATSCAELHNVIRHSRTYVQ